MWGGESSCRKCGVELGSADAIKFPIKKAFIALLTPDLQARVERRKSPKLEKN